jgi:hypothetical protein
MTSVFVGSVRHAVVRWSRSCALTFIALVVAACGSDKAASPDLDGSVAIDARAPTTQGDAQARDARADPWSIGMPPVDTLPPLPKPADAGVVEPPFFGPANPVIYLNDYPRSVYTDAYIYALAANKEIELRGVISSGNDCRCDNGDNYPISNTPATRTEWIRAAREAGFQNIPDNTNGTQGPTLEEPPSGKPSDTVRIGSPGTDLILREAKLATPERPLLLVVGTGLTTIADAYLADPSITKRVVIAALAGLSAESLDDGNGGSDRWATQLVVSSFRVFLFPSTLDVPYTPEARMMGEFPDTALRDLLLGAGYYKENYDSDGSPAVTVMLHAFVKSYSRRVLMEGLTMVAAPEGNIWVMTKGDPVAGGNEFFRALNKAFVNAPPRVVSDAGTGDAAVAVDAGVP